jgi:Cft2 family RNA processing exonuclease
MAAQWDHVKRIPGTNFIVDGFRFSTPDCTCYFLTHAHGDHTTGLSRRWNAGTIICTEVTRRLITSDLGIRSELVRSVPLNTRFKVEGVSVVAVDANHCPGACMFLFEVPGKDGGKAARILHVGDFRYSREQHGHLRDIDTIYLDTTYARPRWNFPAQVSCRTRLAVLHQLAALHG